MSFLLLLFTMLLAAPTALGNMCSGTTMYAVSITNQMKMKTFPGIPNLVFSPISAVTHSGRVSILTVRGFASNEIATVAKTGNNGPLVSLGKKLKRKYGVVKSIAGASGPTTVMKTTTLMVAVDCDNPFLSVVSMIAPSPDWIIQISNMNMFDEKTGMWKTKVTGKLFAYDAGVDDGGDFTDPSDPSLDMPSNPQLNIAPLVEDDTDPFGGKKVGKFVIKRAD